METAVAPAEKADESNVNAVISRQYFASLLLFGLSVKRCQGGSVFLKLPGACQLSQGIRLVHLLAWPPQPLV